MGLLDFIKKFVPEKNRVGIFISPSSILEIAEFDSKTMKVLKYGRSAADYDLSTRQISRTQVLESEILKLYTQHNISFGLPTIMVLPTVLMSQQTLPANLDTTSLEMVLVSEAERNYIFKKAEPTVDWGQVTVNPDDVTQQNVVFSAIQKEEIVKIQNLFQKLDINLIAIDSSYLSLLRGLSLSGLVDEDINEGKLWCILLITSNNFATITLVGDKIIDISEEPLAIRSFGADDVYPVIASYSVENVKIKNPDHLVIVSESNEVSSKILSTYFRLSCKISVVESNKYATEPLFQIENVESYKSEQIVSPEVIGALCWKQSNIPLSFNYLSGEKAVSEDADILTIFGKQVAITPRIITRYIMIFSTIMLILVAAAYLILSSINGANSKLYSDMQTKQGELESEISALKSKSNDNSADDVITTYESNKKIVKSFAAIADTVPEKLWIENLKIYDNLTASMTGKSLTVQDIVNYKESLDKLANFQDFKTAQLGICSSNNSNPAAGSPISGSDISIVTPDKNNSLPALPSITSLPLQDCYEFTFGSLNLPTNTQQPGQQTAPDQSGVPTATGAPAGAPGLPGGLNIPGMPK